MIFCPLKLQVLYSERAGMDKVSTGMEAWSRGARTLGLEQIRCKLCISRPQEAWLL